MKKIAINCWVLRNKNYDGIGNFTIETISRLIASHPEVEFLLLLPKNYTDNYYDYPNASVHRIFPAYRHPLLYVFYLELVLPRFLKKHKTDIFLSTDGYLSLRSNCIQIPVIHDINFEHNPEGLNLKNRLYYQFFFKRFARKATRITTVSEYSKKDISGFYKIDPNKIDIILSGINEKLKPLSQKEIEETRRKWSNGKPYFFFVGSMHPRKNIGRLIQAFNLFKKKNQTDLKLLLAGSILWSKSEIEDIYINSPYKEDIIFTGRLNDNDLNMVLASAYAISFVPIFEGFGLPILEGMQCNVPVICSNTTSMPEVAGDAAILVNPYNVESISNGMEKMFSNPDLDKILVEKGKLQRKLFSWEKTATLLWDSINKILNG